MFVHLLPVRLMLTTEQQNAVARHLNTRAQRPKCPVCGTTSMRVQPEILNIPTTEPDGAPVRRIVVTCTYCGFDMHFAPDVMDLDLD